MAVLVSNLDARLNCMAEALKSFLMTVFWTEGSMPTSSDSFGASMTGGCASALKERGAGSVRSLAGTLNT